MTTITYEFSIGDMVTVKDLKVTGHVIGLFTGLFGNQYEIAYFYDGELKREYLFPFMLDTKVNMRSAFVGKETEG
jgi:hypothetical protein